MVWAKVRNYVIASVGSLAALWAIYWSGRRQGVKNEQNRRREADIKQAHKVQDAADRVRRADGGGLSPVERLRKFSRLRDWSDDL